VERVRAEPERELCRNVRISSGLDRNRGESERESESESEPEYIPKCRGMQTPSLPLEQLVMSDGLFELLR